MYVHILSTGHPENSGHLSNEGRGLKVINHDVSGKHAMRAEVEGHVSIGGRCQ